MTQNTNSEEVPPKTLKQLTLLDLSDLLMWCLFSWALYTNNALFTSGVCLGMATPHLTRFLKNAALLYAERRLKKYP